MYVQTQSSLNNQEEDFHREKKYFSLMKHYINTYLKQKYRNLLTSNVNHVYCTSLSLFSTMLKISQITVGP